MARGARCVLVVLSWLCLGGCNQLFGIERLKPAAGGAGAPAASSGGAGAGPGSQQQDEDAGV